MDLMGIVVMLLIGVATGGIAHGAMRGRLSRFHSIVVGMIGAGIAGFSLGPSLGGGMVGQIVGAIIGAVVLLFVIEQVKRNT